MSDRIEIVSILDKCHGVLNEYYKGYRKYRSVPYLDSELTGVSCDEICCNGENENCCAMSYKDFKLIVVPLLVKTESEIEIIGISKCCCNRLPWEYGYRSGDRLYEDYYNSGIVYVDPKYELCKFLVNALFTFEYMKNPLALEKLVDVFAACLNSIEQPDNGSVTDDEIKKLICHLNREYTTTETESWLTLLDQIIVLCSDYEKYHFSDMIVPIVRENITSFQY